MAQINEKEFKLFESKIDEVLRLLHNMNESKELPEPDAEKKSLKDSVNNEALNEDDFIVKVRDNRTIINDSISDIPKKKEPHTVDKFTFMQQLEEDAAKRAENRKNREVIADNFRRLGNEAYREKRYEEAINLYTKALDHIKDSPILYNNRALSCIKIRVYKRAVIDCDFVINRLDEKNLRAWLYRAVAYYNLQDDVNFQQSIKMAKKHNSNDIDYIEKFLKTIKDV